MRISTITFTKMHMYNQAEELDVRDCLHQFLTNIPASRYAQFAISSSKVTINPLTGILNALMVRYFARFVPYGLRKRFDEALIRVYSSQANRSLKLDSDALIVLSLVRASAVRRAKKLGIPIIIDSANSHIRNIDAILTEEYRCQGFKQYRHISESIIQRMEDLYAQADHILAGSKFVRQSFIERGFAADRVHVNHYGVNLEEFTPGPKPDKVFRIIFCGRVKLRKGVHYLIKAFNELKLKNAELWLIGGGHIEGALAKAFKKMELSMDQVFFKGRYPQDKLCELYRHGSVFCLPSLEEGLAMVIPQALAAGLPCIVSTNSGGQDLIQDGQNGYVIPIRDIEKLKEKILYCYENPDAVAEMSVNAVKSVKNGFSWADYGDRLVELLKAIIK